MFRLQLLDVGWVKRSVPIRVYLMVFRLTGIAAGSRGDDRGSYDRVAGNG